MYYLWSRIESSDDHTIGVYDGTTWTDSNATVTAPTSGSIKHNYSGTLWATADNLFFATVFSPTRFWVSTGAGFTDTTLSPSAANLSTAQALSLSGGS